MEFGLCLNLLKSRARSRNHVCRAARLVKTPRFPATLSTPPPPPRRDLAGKGGRGQQIELYRSRPYRQRRGTKKGVDGGVRVRPPRSWAARGSVQLKLPLGSHGKGQKLKLRQRLPDAVGLQLDVPGSIGVECWDLDSEIEFSRSAGSFVIGVGEEGREEGMRGWGGVTVLLQEVISLEGTSSHSVPCQCHIVRSFCLCDRTIITVSHNTAYSPALQDDSDCS